MGCSLESPVCLDFPHSLSYILPTTGTPNLLQSKLPLLRGPLAQSARVPSLVREHTPLCSSSAKYTNEKPPSPNTLTILTIAVDTCQSCATSSIIDVHVRPLILTFADCWHTQDDSAQKASLIWYLMLSSVLCS